MRVLLVYCHPLQESYNGALHREVKNSLLAEGHQVDDCDLYAEQFNPVLSAEERANYHSIPGNQLPVSDYVTRLKAAEALVFCFPVWNFNLPAMLKGFFDRVFLPGVSFELTESGKVETTLSHIREIRTITTYGGPRWAAWAMGDPPRKLMTRVLHRVTRGQSRVKYLACYDMNRASAKRRERFKRQVTRSMQRLAA